MGTTELRAVTFNIHSGINQEEDAYSLERIAASAMQREPHVLCIQETECSAGEGQRTRKWSWEHGDDQVARLAELTGLAHTLWAPALHGVRFNPEASGDTRVAGERGDAGLTEEVLDRDGAGDYGVAVLSAWPFVQTRLLTYSCPEGADGCKYYMDREQQPRGAAAALVRPPGGAEALWVVTTHLSHKFGSEEQRAQARELAEWCDALRAEHECPLILAGDTNSIPGGPQEGAWHVVTGHGSLQDAAGGDSTATVLGGGVGLGSLAEITGLTFPSNNPRARIDQFFVSSDVAVRCVEVIGTEDPHASDHLPVLLTAQLPGAVAQSADL